MVIYNCYISTRGILQLTAISSPHFGQFIRFTFTWLTLKGLTELFAALTAEVKSVTYRFPFLGGLAELEILPRLRLEIFERLVRCP